MFKHPTEVFIPDVERGIQDIAHGFNWYCTNYTINGTIDVFYKSHVSEDEEPSAIALCWRHEDGAYGEYLLPDRIWMRLSRLSSMDKTKLEQLLFHNQKLILHASEAHGVRPLVLQRFRNYTFFVWSAEPGTDMHIHVARSGEYGKVDTIELTSYDSKLVEPVHVISPEDRHDVLAFLKANKAEIVTCLMHEHPHVVFSDKVQPTWSAIHAGDVNTSEL